MNLSDQLNSQKRKVDFNTYDISVKELVSMVRESYIDISPTYQRHFRWDEIKQSKLIESVFLGIPVPSLFMATNSDSTWEVVDGVQRLSTLIHFAGDDEAREKLNFEKCLKIKSLDKLTELNGLYFSDLDKMIQMDFMLKPVKITTLSDKSDLSVRFDLFERLNTGGIALSDQEIRNCIYRGSFSEFLSNMAEYNNFNEVVFVPEKSKKDGYREEMVLRYFAFLEKYKSFEHSVVDFLNDYMFKATKKFKYNEYEKLFKKTFDELKDNLPEGITRGRKTTPVNLYEAVAVGTAIALLEKDKLNFENFYTFLQSDAIKTSTTGATNSRAQVAKRIETVRDYLLR